MPPDGIESADCQFVFYLFRSKMQWRDRRGRTVCGTDNKMARPREFDENEVLDAAGQCFWARGYEGTSLRGLIESTGLTGASLYNAFGDKRALYQKTLDRYVEGSIADRIRRCQDLPPRQAIGAFFEDIITRSLNDAQRKGCMLVNAALEVAPHDPGFQKLVAQVLVRLEQFFRRTLAAGQADGTITTSQSAEDLAHHLLGVLIAIRVLVRVRPEKALLKGIVRPALALLDGPRVRMSRRRKK
jgi:TetR/AcrR family transcriptional repressor of nem operon